MNKVTTIHLHGRPYQVEEPGFNRLQQYLADAADKLSQDPDKDEIVADLEQSIGEKFDHFLTPSKTVVLEKEVEDVLKEMGPVQADSEMGEQGSPEQGAPKTSAAPKRLFKVREGAMVSGVCMGLAAYFDADVTLFRIAFVALILLTGGAGILVYIVMAIVLPVAKTSAERAAAFGEPFTAQEFVDRAKEEYSRFSSSDERKKWKNDFKKWKYELKDKIRQERRERRAQYYHGGNGPWVARPFLGFISAVLIIGWLVGLATLIGHHAVFGWAVPLSIPLWAAILIWLCVYSFVSWPVKAARYAGTYSYEYGGQVHYHHHHAGFLSGISWLIFLCVAVWFAWHYVPVAHPVLERAQTWWNHVSASLVKR